MHRKTHALPRYRSFLGLARGLIQGNLPLARRLCRDAVEEAPYEPDLLLNLGRIEERMGHLADARRAYQRGFHVANDKAIFLRHLGRLDRPHHNVVPFPRPPRPHLHGTA